MNILIVTAAFPYPLEQGSQIRNFYLIRHLAKRHDIFLLSLCKRMPSPLEISELSQYCVRIECVENRRTNFVKLKDFLSSIVQRVPYTMIANTSFNLQKKLKALLDEDTVDLLQFQELYVCGNLPSHYQGATALDAHNAEGLILSRAARNTKNPFKKLFYNFEAKKMRHVEKKFASSVDFVFCVSEAERNHFMRFNRHTFVVPNGTEVVYKPDSTKRNAILFTGSLNYPPNRDGLFFFLRRIWPTIAAKNPEMEMHIVGRTPPAKLKKFSNDRVKFFTNVDDIRPFFEQSLCLVVPLWAGAGTRLKILQAFSHHLPVVSTSVGTEGIAVKNETHLLITDDEQNFANAVCQLVSNRSLREALAENASNLISERYLWRDIAANCDTAYKTVLG